MADETRRLFRESRGRDPNAEELAGLTRRWVDNEILYREGLALGVDQGDNMIRERVIFKSLMVVESGLKLPPIDDQALRAWFETQRAKCDEPSRYDVQEAVLAADTPEATVQAFVVALNQGAPGDTNAGLRVFKGRPHANLVQSYDHLLFVVGLLFLVGFRRRLVWTISAFTLAHSLTLASPALRWAG